MSEMSSIVNWICRAISTMVVWALRVICVMTLTIGFTAGVWVVVSARQSSKNTICAS
jgi:hypothetical protein